MDLDTTTGEPLKVPSVVKGDVVIMEGYRRLIARELHEMGWNAQHLGREGRPHTLVTLFGEVSPCGYGWRAGGTVRSNTLVEATPSDMAEARGGSLVTSRSKCSFKLLVFSACCATKGNHCL